MLQYQVSELTDRIKQLLEGGFPGLIMVKGELSEFSRAASGHIYFSLKDEKAKIKAAYFRHNIRSDAFIPKNGDQVSAIGELRTYAPDGSYQLIVRKVVYNGGGEFWKKFETTKALLNAEGFFAEGRKRRIPKYPKRIALLTAATGAAVKDFIVNAQKAGGVFQIDLWSIPVQGKDAATAIVKALTQAGRRSDLYDILVLTRGGGSLDDLAVFNEESVARALASSSVPTISAIGHEHDVSICDLVADERASTPTAAAQRVAAEYGSTLKNLENLSQRLLTMLRFRLENVTLGFDKLSTRLEAAGPKAKLEKENNRFFRLSSALVGGLRGYINLRNKRLEQVSAGLFALSPVARLTRLRHQTELFATELDSSVKRCLALKRHHFEMLHERLRLTDPERLLSLGYALVLKDGQMVTGINKISLEDSVEIKMHDGNIDAYVIGKRRRQ